VDDPELDRLLDGARNDLPSSTELAHLRERLGLPRPSPPASPTSGPWAWGAVAIGLAAALFAVTRPAPPPIVPPRADVVPAAAPAAPAAVPGAAEPTGALSPIVEASPIEASPIEASSIEPQPERAQPERAQPDRVRAPRCRRLPGARSVPAWDRRACRVRPERSGAGRARSSGPEATSLRRCPRYAERSPRALSEQPPRGGAIEPRSGAGDRRGPHARRRSAGALPVCVPRVGPRCAPRSPSPCRERMIS
jgi:hypothetical protein